MLQFYTAGMLVVDTPNLKSLNWEEMKILSVEDGTGFTSIGKWERWGSCARGRPVVVDLDEDGAEDGDVNTEERADT
jgi:hypothetical protein